MSKYLGLREEHMDLFSTLVAGTSYTPGKAFTSADSYGTEIKGNVISRTADDIALWRAKLLITEAFASSGSATLTVKIYGAKELNANGTLKDPTTVYASSAIALASLVADAWLLDMVLPSGFFHYQVSLTPGTAAFTAGAVQGFVEPEFN